MTAAGLIPPMPFFGHGLLDTGAGSTAIDRSIVAKLGLSATGSVQVLTASTGSNPIQVNEYDVSVWFEQPPTPGQIYPTRHAVHLTLAVTEGEFSSNGFDVLIGRDVLSQGVLIYNGLLGLFSIAV
jgi:hypothetical protein